MSAARFTVSFGGLSHARAFEVMDLLENDLRLDPLAVSINETDEAKALWETVAWFALLEEADAARVVMALPYSVVSAVPERDWVRESLAGLGPVSAGRFHLHGSHDRGVHPSGIVLEIDAGTAFGTGHHGTTWGCLAALDDIVKRRRPRRILDLGTGTGVLGLAAAKHLKRPVLATDIDPVAVKVAIDNAKRNGALPWFKGRTAAGLHHPSISTGAPFDLIFANILARPLASLAPGLAKMLSAGGQLILSGLTVDQLRWIKACYVNQGLVVERIIRSGNWIALVMGRKALGGTASKRKSPALSSKAAGLGYLRDA